MTQLRDLELSKWILALKPHNTSLWLSVEGPFPSHKPGAPSPGYFLLMRVACLPLGPVPAECAMDECSMFHWPKCVLSRFLSVIGMLIHCFLVVSNKYFESGSGVFWVMTLCPTLAYPVAIEGHNHNNTEIKLRA